jgi:hypothetical protein
MLNLEKIHEYMVDNELDVHGPWYFYMTENHIVPHLDCELITANLSDPDICAMWGDYHKRCRDDMDEWQRLLNVDIVDDFMPFKRYLWNEFKLI